VTLDFLIGRHGWRLAGSQSLPPGVRLGLGTRMHDAMGTWARQAPCEDPSGAALQWEIGRPGGARQQGLHRLLALDSITFPPHQLSNVEDVLNARR